MMKKGRLKKAEPESAREVVPLLPKRATSSLRCIALIILACSGSLRALEVTEWKNRQPLKVEAPGIISVALPAETLDVARADLGDLRIVDPAGQEVAFLLRRGSRPTVRAAAAKSFRSTLTGSSTQLLIEGGDVAITDVMLETPASEFIKSAQVETSADGQTWRIAESGIPVFRQRGVDQLRLQVNAPFVRITLDDTRSRPVPFTGAKVLPAIATESNVQPVEVRIARREEFAGETVLTLELAAAHVPLDSLTIATPERLFTRRVSVGVRELRDESAVERTMASGTIFNVAIDGGARTTNFALPLDFTAPSRELSVHITNDDSPPLVISGVQVSRFEVIAYFDAPLAGEYTLLSGHPQATTPRYDVAGIRVGNTTRTTAITPGSLAANPGYRAPEALAGTALLGGALDPAPWIYRKAVQVATAGVQQLELDLDVLVHASPGFADLRLVREGAQIPYLLERPALSRSLDLAISPSDDPKRPRVSRWLIKLPRAGLPLSRMTLNSPTALFQRHVRVFEKISDDRGNTYERTLASSDWSHTPDDRRALALTLTHAPTTDTLVVETDNGDNPPVSIGSVAATYPVTRLLFKSDAPPALYYGNRQAAAPRYDLALVARQILAAEKNIALLGPEEKTKSDGWAKTAFSGAKGGLIFWSALAMVVIVLLAVVAKLLPKPPAESA
jgi:hypothetical protein